MVAHLAGEWVQLKFFHHCVCISSLHNKPFLYPSPILFVFVSLSPPPLNGFLIIPVIFHYSGMPGDKYKNPQLSVLLKHLTQSYICSENHVRNAYAS